MSRFIVSRTENGVSFCLLAQNGRRLATSRTYATLDACKKGIASLIANAPNVPLVDSSAGEYGKNPKFEVVQDGEGFGFLLKSANGKSVIVSSPYATKKACLRAVSMLRKGVLSADVLFLQKEGVVPVTMTAHLAAVGVAVAERKQALPSPPSPLEEPDTLRATESVEEAWLGIHDGVAADAPEEEPIAAPFAASSAAAPKTPAATAVAPKVPAATAAARAAVPRVVRLQPTLGARQAAPKKAAVAPKTSSAASLKSPRTLLNFLLKRK